MRISTVKFTCWLILGMSFHNLVSARNSGMFILDTFADKRTQFQSISYDIVLEMKRFSTEDTSVYSANVELVRNTADSLYGGIFSLIIEDSVWYGYDGKNIKQVLLDSSILTIGDPHTSRGLWVQSTWVNEA